MIVKKFICNGKTYTVEREHPLNSDKPYMPSRNKTWPDGREIVPMPGMLVALDDGSWDVLTEWHEESESWEQPQKYIVFSLWSDRNEYEGSFAPLAPAPTPGGLWAALSNISGNDVPTISNLIVIHNYVARTHVIFDNRRYTRCEFEVRQPRYLTNDRLLLLDTALQRHHALLAYCSQPGWKTQHA